jgi:hypothetical protein
MTTDNLNAERKKASFRLRHRLFFGNMPGRPKGFNSDHEAILSYALITQEQK